MRNWTQILALFLGLSLHAQEATWTSVQDINPFIGTGGHGHTHPSEIPSWDARFIDQ
jgi:hypothetical protein